MIALKLKLQFQAYKKDVTVEVVDGFNDQREQPARMWKTRNMKARSQGQHCRSFRLGDNLVEDYISGRLKMEF